MSVDRILDSIASNDSGFNKSGRGNLTTRVTLLITWIKEIDIDQERREIKSIFENEKL